MSTLTRLCEALNHMIVMFIFCIETSKDEHQDQKQPHLSGNNSQMFTSEPRSYPSPYVPGHPQGAFDKESIPPLGANVESWSNLLDHSRTTSRMDQPDGNHGYRPRASTEDLDDDEVFFDDDDMRRMRLGLADPGDPYNPSAYTTMAMMGAGPEQSHLGQGLAYYGPGYHVGASGMDIFFCVWNIFTYLLDVGSDIYLAYMYYTASHYIWFGLTIGFVAVPSISMSIFSLILYIKDWKRTGEKGSACHWVSRVTFIIIQLAPLLRLLETLVLGCKSRDPDKEILKRRQYYDRMVDEDTDSMLIRLFEAFMESAPQLVLQLYIITQIGTDKGVFLVVVQVIGLVTSMLSLASTLVSFQKSLRLSQTNKDKLRFPGMMIMFLWRLFTISARVLALALFASYFKFWVFVVIGVHWLAMLIWVVRQNTIYCASANEEGIERRNKCQELCFRILAAFVQIFCFFNLLEGHTRLRCLLFYSLIYVENAVLVLGWYIGASTTTVATWYHLPSLLVVLLGFWFGIFFQVVYYKCYHPNNYSVLHTRRRILWCIKCEHLSLTKETHYEPEPAPSEVIKSQLTHHLNMNQTMQSVQSSHYATYPQEQPPFVPMPAYSERAPTHPALQPVHPPDTTSMFSRSTSLNNQPADGAKPSKKVVQKKWQPPERLAAGNQKLNSFDSDSTFSTTTTGTGTGYSQHRSSSPQTRAMKRAKRKAERAKAMEKADPDNDEPLPLGRPAPREPPSVYRSPPHPDLLPSNEEPLPLDQHRHQVSRQPANDVNDEEEPLPPQAQQYTAHQRAALPAQAPQRYDESYSESDTSLPEYPGAQILQPVDEADGSLDESNPMLKVTAI